MAAGDTGSVHVFACGAGGDASARADAAMAALTESDSSAPPSPALSATPPPTPAALATTQTPSPAATQTKAVKQSPSKSGGHRREFSREGLCSDADRTETIGPHRVLSGEHLSEHL